MKKEIVDASAMWAALLFFEVLRDKSSIVSCCLLLLPPALVSAKEHGSVAQGDEGLLVRSPKMRRPS